MEEEEGFLDPELLCEVSEVDREGDSFDVFPSRADEALKTCKSSGYIKKLTRRVLKLQNQSLLLVGFFSGRIKASPGEPADVPGGSTTNQTFHGSPSAKNHLFADADRQPRKGDGSQRLREEQL